MLRHEVAGRVVFTRADDLRVAPRNEDVAPKRVVGVEPRSVGPRSFRRKAAERRSRTDAVDGIAYNRHAHSRLRARELAHIFDHPRRRQGDYMGDKAVFAKPRKAGARLGDGIGDAAEDDVPFDTPPDASAVDAIFRIPCCRHAIADAADALAKCVVACGCRAGDAVCREHSRADASAGADVCRRRVAKRRLYENRSSEEVGVDDPVGHYATVGRLGDLVPDRASVRTVVFFCKFARPLPIPAALHDRRAAAHARRLRLQDGQLRVAVIHALKSRRPVFIVGHLDDSPLAALVNRHHVVGAAVGICRCRLADDAPSRRRAVRRLASRLRDIDDGVCLAPKTVHEVLRHAVQSIRRNVA